MIVTIAIEIVIGMLILAMLLSLWRLLRGPTDPDRILALDTLYINTMGLLVLFGLRLGTNVYFEVSLIIAMLGFAGTIALSKFVIRGRIIE